MKNLLLGYVCDRCAKYGNPFAVFVIIKEPQKNNKINDNATSVHKISRYLLESCQHSLVIFATVYMTPTLFQRPNYRQFNETNPYPCLPWGTCPSPLCSPASGRGCSCAISLPPCILPDRGLPCYSCTPMAAGNSCHSGHTPLSHIPYFPSPFQHTLSPYHHGSRSLFLCC